MTYILFLAGLVLGIVLGFGIALIYINRKFTSSLKSFEEEMEFLEQLEEETRKE